MFRAKNYKELTRLFLIFVLPAISSQLLSGVYTIVDGFFVGWGVGQEGLAAIGLAFPFTVAVSAIGAGIGVGGGALMSLKAGSKDEEGAGRILGAMMSMTLAASLCCMLFTPFVEYLLSWYAVAPDTAAMAHDYAWILFVSAPAQIITMAMLGAVRNDGFPRKAMYIMTASFCVNMALDWLLVIIFDFRIAGAAWATVISQGVSAVLLLAHFFSGRSRTKASFTGIPRTLRLAKHIAAMGVAPFGVQIATAVTMTMYNWQALAYGGDVGVAAYAVVGYILPVGVMLEEGIAEGIQPLVSYYHGANLTARRQLTARMGFGSAIVIGLLCSVLLYFSAAYIPEFFSLSGAAESVARRGLLLSVPVFPFLGIAKIGASFYQAVGRSEMASAVTYSDPFLLQPLFLWLLPMSMGLDGVWLAQLCANFTLAFAFVFIWKRGASAKLPMSASSTLGLF